MAPVDFERAGLALFGKRWKTAMARALELDVATVWRYTTGQTPIPKPVELAIRYLVLTDRRTHD